MRKSVASRSVDVMTGRTEKRNDDSKVVMIRVASVECSAVDLEECSAMETMMIITLKVAKEVDLVVKEETKAKEISIATNTITLEIGLPIVHLSSMMMMKMMMISMDYSQEDSKVETKEETKVEIKVDSKVDSKVCLFV